MLRGFEHVGMTSGDLDRTIHFYCELLGLTLALRRQTEFGEMAFFDTGAGMLEVFAPKAQEIGRFRDVPPHEAGMRHLTFAFDDIDAVFQRLVDAGVEIVEKPRDAINREMLKRVAFVRDGDGILVELAERAEGRN
ncbi:VOC family protein [Devosia sp. PTR5]|jgi:glyoxylase I family protein|uniref:VOC family protein n=1 Tax=Devosia oryzisoli TaxID=2774138 RepID=A0A927IQ62_9HYPH|nr:VOC family protein [Devosia oryzisoli]MBD8065295.1 VOC family protein [Devosia oryzisoli]